MPIPRLWGTSRLGGCVIWSRDLREEARSETLQDNPWPTPDTEITYYFYYGTFAVALCRNEIIGITKMWADSKLIYNVNAEDDEEVTQIDGLNFRIYYGTTDQSADPWMEETEGAGEVPAYRGVAYIVFNDLPLEMFGNRLPNMTFEVTTAGTPSGVIEHGIAGIDSYNSLKFVPELDGIHMIHVSPGHDWDRVSFIRKEVVHNVITTETPDYSDFDINQDGDIISTGDSPRTNKSSLVQMSGKTFFTLRQYYGLYYPEVPYEEEDQIPSPYYVHVFRNKRYPYAIFMDYLGGMAIRRYTTRYWDEVGSFAGPGNFYWLLAAMDHENGRFWAIANAAAGPTLPPKIYSMSYSGVNAGEITDSLPNGANLIAYCPMNNVVIVASGYLADTFKFYDADTGTLLGTLTGASGSLLGAWSRPWFAQGPVNGYLYLHNNTTTISRIDVARMVVDKQWTTNINMTGGGIYNFYTHSVFVGANPGTFDRYIIELDRMTVAGVPLSEIVTDVCVEAGLSESGFDVSELTDIVFGYVNNSVSSGRSVIQPLMDAYFFDCVERDGKLYFPKRGKDSVVTIPESDLAAHVSGEERPQNLVIRRKMHLEVPHEVAVSYQDKDSHYETNTQYARRLVGNARGKLSINLPIVLTADEAAQIADKHLMTIWKQRNSHRAVILGRKYSYLAPADVIKIQENGNEHTLRVERMSAQGGILPLDLVGEDASTYSSEKEGVSPPAPDDSVDWPGPTQMTLMDIPLLPNSPGETAGLYVATTGLMEAWNGAHIYISRNDGATFDFLMKSVRNAYAGHAVLWGKGGYGVSPRAVVDPFVWDDYNELHAMIFNQDDPTFPSYTKEEAMNRSGLIAFGNEIISYRNVEKMTANWFIFTGLLRGRFGSDSSVNTGTEAEERTFVLLDNIYFQPLGDDEIGQDRIFRAVSIGRPLSIGHDIEHTVIARCLYPLSPQHLKGSLEDNDDITLTWFRRSRWGSDWVNCPLGEDSEAYNVYVKLWNDSDGDWEDVRTIEVTETEATYTAAMQATDGYSWGDRIAFAVAQVSATVGDGFESDTTEITDSL